MWFTRKERRNIVKVAVITAGLLLLLDKLLFLKKADTDAILPLARPISDSSKDTEIIFAEDQPKPMYSEPKSASPELFKPKKALPLLTHIDNTSSTIRTHHQHDGSFFGGRICEKDISEKYHSIENNPKFEENLKWCKDIKSRANVVIGRSWGSMSKFDQLKWDEVKCNELMSLGKLQSCDERWGWGSFNLWLRNSKTVVHSLSNVTCVMNLKTSTFCQFERVVMDFGKLGVAGASRRFGSGFLKTFGKVVSYAAYPQVPGIAHVSSSKEAEESVSTVEEYRQQCEEIETRPAFVLSNDDIFNLGHYFNDVMGIWNMVVLANQADSKQSSILINIDGVRSGGPAGGPAHRLMVKSDPDAHGPYVRYYNSWFQEVRRGVDYGKKNVCFEKLYFPPQPGVPWFWNDWGQINDCSVRAASPLYQSFNLFLRERWRNAFGKESLQLPPQRTFKGAGTEADVHIVIEVRSINPSKTNNHSSARYIRNLQELIAALQSIPGVRVTAQDFAKIPFEEQVSLSHSASVFMSMHGAGTTHIFHSAIGQPNCCALVELFPDPSIEFHTAHGYGNIARMLGMHHYRVVAPRGSTTSKGTTVDVAAIKQQALKAVDDVRLRPTCLNEVKNTMGPVYGHSEARFV